MRAYRHRNPIRKGVYSTPEDLALSKRTKAVCSMESHTDSISEHVQSTCISLDADSIQAIAIAVKDTIFEQLQASMATLVESVVGGVMNDLSTRVDALEKTNSTLRDEKEELLERIQSLERQADSAEQYSRRNCLRLSGVKEDADEVTDDVIMDIFKDMGAGVTLCDIDRSHRIGKPKAGRQRNYS